MTQNTSAATSRLPQAQASAGRQRSTAAPWRMGWRVLCVAGDRVRHLWSLNWSISSVLDSFLFLVTLWGVFFFRGDVLMRCWSEFITLLECQQEQLTEETNNRFKSWQNHRGKKRFQLDKTIDEIPLSSKQNNPRKRQSIYDILKIY